MRKNIILFLFLFFLAFSSGVFAQTIRGKILDAQTGESIIGASVVLKDQRTKGTVSGLDGSFVITNVATFPVTLSVSFIGYKPQEIVVANATSIVVNLEEDQLSLNEVVILGSGGGRTEVSARAMEMNAMNVINIVSAKAIELSPDLTVGNVVQRVSGVSVERNATGEGQYAILRGMDKRYNYTLIDGIKVPSPDNKNRYIPLDIFPSDMLDRLDVTKSLTPRFEGDAVGGVINMVMKTAPDHFVLNGNLAMGYSQMFFNNPFYGFDWRAINYKSPMEMHGDDLMYNSTIADFSMKNMDPVKRSFVPNINAGFTIGNRFLNKRLGVMLAGSYQINHRGSSTLRTSVGTPSKTQVGKETGVTEREMCTQQYRLGTIAKIDYIFSDRHQLALNGIYTNLKSVQHRYSTSTSVNVDPQDFIQSASYRLQFRDQSILNASLKGLHRFSPKWTFDWTASYANATGQMPDRVNIGITQQHVVNGEIVSRTLLFGNSPPINRTWEHTFDHDISGYANGSYVIETGNINGNILFGGMYRKKDRTNFYNNYDLFPEGYLDDPLKRQIDVYDDTLFSEFDLTPYNPKGSASNPATYTASENIGGGYVEAEIRTGKFEILGGLRAEHTYHFYRVTYQSPIASLAIPDRKNNYLDLLPSIAVKYKLTPTQNLRLSYYHSINRPSYYEMVPFTVSGDTYTERGNPDLKRAQIDNIDFRYEIFPSPAEQIMAGVFYKNIKDPIEYAMQPLPNSQSPDLYYMPGNFGTATNYGMEFDFIKYFHSIGVKANYTFTQSGIKQPKNWFIDQEPIMVEQTRPLFGQSKHIWNATLMFRSSKMGLDAQFSTSYTGERLSYVSLFYNNDLWQEGYLQGDFSIDKRFKNGISIYGKLNNIFNTRQKEYIKASDPVNEGLPYQNPSSGKTFISREYYGQSFIIGFRFKFSK